MSYEERIEQRNKQLKQLEASRNRISKGYLCKKDKERELRRKRALEASLDLPVEAYNKKVLDKS